MRTGNLISPSHRSSLPLRPLFVAFSSVGVGGVLRRVAGWGSSFFCPAYARASDFLSSLFTAVMGLPPPASRVGASTAAFVRLCPGERRVFLSGAQASVLRISSASRLPAVCGILLPIMLMPSPASNPAVEGTPNKRALFASHRLARRPSLLR
uniref:Orf1 n=1 Tax=Proteus mirabilis TaxID=584 RepID=A0SKJ4_PROMI|nr:orf1 [Proteus mirabilis]